MLFSLVNQNCSIEQCTNRPQKELLSKKVLYNIQLLNTQPYNLNQLVKLCGGDAELFHKLLTMYLSASREAISELEKGLSNNDFVLIKRTLYKFKPALYNLDINILYDDISLIETYYSLNIPSIDVKEKIQKIRNTLLLVFDDLKDL